VSERVAGSTRRSAVIYNPIKVDVERLKTVVGSAASAAGWAEPDWLPTTVDDAGQLLTRAAIDAGAQLVIAAGGDGTVRAVAETLRGTGIPLGLVPTGTGNLLARNLALPLSALESAARIAYSDAQRAIDIGIAELTTETGERVEYAFLVMAGLGLDAALIANTRPELKSKVGWLAYVDAGVRSLPRLGNVRVTFSTDKHPEHTARMSTILIANCGSLPGNIQLFPDARVDDGRLDIAILQPTSLFGWLLIWRKVTWENRVLRRTSFGRQFIELTSGRRRSVISYLRGESIILGVADPEPFEIDGDDVGLVRAARLSVDPGALLVKAP
jgi:diacylglycerol kinase family enzyme